MIRLIPALLILSLAVPARAADSSEVAKAAEEKTSSSKVKSLKNWFVHWKQALDRSAVEGRYRRGRGTVAVAAVRGAGQASEDPKKPYWKGGWSAAKSAQLMKERRELAAAVSEILEGHAKKGAELLAAFKKTHPESTLLADVRMAESKIDEWSKEAELAPAQPEPSEESSPETEEEAKPAEKKSAESE